MGCKFWIAVEGDVLDVGFLGEGEAGSSLNECYNLLKTFAILCNHCQQQYRHKKDFCNQCNLLFNRIPKDKLCITFV